MTCMTYFQSVNISNRISLSCISERLYPHTYSNKVTLNTNKTYSAFRSSFSITGVKPTRMIIKPILSYIGQYTDRVGPDTSNIGTDRFFPYQSITIRTPSENSIPDDMTDIMKRDSKEQQYYQLPVSRTIIQRKQVLRRN